MVSRRRPRRCTIWRLTKERERGLSRLTRGARRSKRSPRGSASLTGKYRLLRGVPESRCGERISSPSRRAHSILNDALSQLLVLVAQTRVFGRLFGEPAPQIAASVEQHFTEIIEVASTVAENRLEARRFFFQFIGHRNRLRSLVLASIIAPIFLLPASSIVLTQHAPIHSSMLFRSTSAETIWTNRNVQWSERGW